MNTTNVTEWKQVVGRNSKVNSNQMVHFSFNQMVNSKVNSNPIVTDLFHWIFNFNISICVKKKI